MYVLELLFRCIYTKLSSCVLQKAGTEDFATHVGMRECSARNYADKGMEHGCCSSIEWYIGFDSIYRFYDKILIYWDLNN